MSVSDVNFEFSYCTSRFFTFRSEISISSLSNLRLREWKSKVSTYRARELWFQVASLPMFPQGFLDLATERLIVLSAHNQKATHSILFTLPQTASRPPFILEKKENPAMVYRYVHVVLHYPVITNVLERECPSNIFKMISVKVNKIQKRPHLLDKKI